MGMATRCGSGCLFMGLIMPPGQHRVNAPGMSCGLCGAAAYFLP
jgi:hypothetical protein